MNGKLKTWISDTAMPAGRSRAKGIVAVCLIAVVFFGLAAAILQVASPSQVSSPVVVAQPKPAVKKPQRTSIFSAASLLQTPDQRKNEQLSQKADTLAQLVRNMPGVKDAKVIIEPGQPGRLGKKAVKASAVVYVDFQPDGQMTSDMLESTVMLVAGAVGGLDERGVRVVSSRGMSYKLDDVGVLPGDTAAELVIKKKQENALQEKISEALGYIPGLGVSVTVKPLESQWQPSEVVVNLPRSFAENIYYKSDAHKAGGQSGEVVASIMEEQTQRIREIVTLAGGKGAAIVVQWYYDPAETTAAVAAEPAQAGAIIFIAGMSLAELVIIGLLVYVRLSRRQHRKAWARLRAMARRRRKSTKRGGFDFLRLVGEDELVILLKKEKPLAVALALTHLSPAKAAAVLGRLGSDMQIEVAKRMAGIENVAPEVSKNIARRLVQRMEVIIGETNADGVAAVAKILQHSNNLGRKKVLEALKMQEPRLAESIGRLLVSFEDVAEMPQETLAPALESMQIDEIATALWSSSENVQRNVFEAMPIDRTKEVMVKMQGMGRVRAAQIDAAQQQLVELIRDCEIAKTAIAKASEKVIA